MIARKNFTAINVIVLVGFFLSANITLAQPLVLDKGLKVEHLIEVQFKPSNMAFINHDDILILDREQGKVYRILDFKMKLEPLLDVNVATVGYRGMLGIDTLMRKDNVTYVFLYYTESIRKDGDDQIDSVGLEPLGNRLYK